MTGTPNKCVQVWAGYGTTQQIFSETSRSASLGRASWTRIFGDNTSEPNCNLNGINQAPHPNTSARFGLVGNNEDDCASPDYAIGLGILAGGSRMCGAGLVQTVPSAAASCSQGTLWIR